MSKAYRNMTFTSPDLTADQSYTAFTGGTVSGGTDFHGLRTGATHTGGTLWNTFNTNAVVTYVGVTPGGRPGRP